MRWPTLSVQQESVEQVDVFGGYNHNLRIGDGEFYDMENLTSDQYPQMASRAPRGVYIDKQVDGMIEKDSLCYVSGGSFYINNKAIDGLLLSAGKKQLIGMGAFVIILPDRKWINTVSEDYGSIDASWDSSGVSVSINLCARDGTVKNADTFGDTPPENPENMELWVDTSGEKHTLRMWSESTKMWVAQATTYVRIDSPGIGERFSRYDGVEIDGLQNLTGEGYQQIRDLNGSAVLWECGNDYIVITGIVDQGATLPDGSVVTLSRTMPDMDFVTEHNNRLWGCRYGMNRKGEVVNELYACKLGDFKNWNCFMGISTDSYAVSLGSDGPFTGAITHGNYPLFFKENCIHKVYGQIPSNFQVQTVAGRGVQKGSEDSLAIVNEVLYYKGKNGVCAYDGSVPVEVSSQFGDIRYSMAAGAAHGNKYYVSMLNTDTSEKELLVYDTRKGMWTKENDPGISSMCSCRGILYAATSDQVITLSGGTAVGKTNWSATTGVIGALTPQNKYLQRIVIRMILEPDSTVAISAQYNSNGPWEKLASMVGKDMKAFAFTIRPVRCDHLRLKLTGEGKCIVYAITKHMVMGSDMHDRD